MDINGFIEYLKKEKKPSENTLMAYTRDVKAFIRYMEKTGGTIEGATETDIASYVMELNKTGRSRATVNRKLASLRAAFDYLKSTGIASKDPTKGIKTPRAERKDLEFLSIEEIEKILAQPDDSIKGKRDKAILEVLYGTGIKAMELINFNYSDLNIRMGYIQCSGEHGKHRIVPLGSFARTALTEYLRDSRPALLKSDENKEMPDRPLFTNYVGERLTRQGLWKIISEYGRKANIKRKITPHILRSSFAVHMIQNGADVKTLQELMGYDDMQAMQIYMQISKTRIKDVYDKTHPRA